MSDNMIVLLGAIGLCVVILLWTGLRWSRTHSARTATRGLGALLAVVGIWVLGLGLLVLHGVRALIDWAQGTAHTTKVYTGLGLLVVGVLLWLVGSLIRPVAADVAKQRRLDRRQAQQARSVTAQGRTSGATAAGTASLAKPASAGKAAVRPADGLSDEDAEIEQLLKARGIE